MNEFLVFYFLFLLQVRLELEEPEPGVTVAKLTHTDVPEEDRLGILFNDSLC